MRVLLQYRHGFDCQRIASSEKRPLITSEQLSDTTVRQFSQLLASPIQASRLEAWPVKLGNR